ncbi:MarR family transcriptional regulator [Streptomyces sp. NPDC006134]|uniref:MarR family winged helix-turn-helix transcriptional regulator n=1 Tax=Streptomyces sp. NPDC006134 TaxID=3154467 RepID=UPI0034063DB5
MTDTASAEEATDATQQPLQTAAERFPVSFAVFSLARRHRALAAELLRGTGLYVGQELMLMQLWEHDGQSQTSLGRTLGLDHSTVAKSVRRLEEAGLVTRVRSERDRRSTLVHLTEAGRGLRASVMDAWARLEEATVQGLTARERERFAGLAHRIEENLDATALPGGGETGCC